MQLYTLMFGKSKKKMKPIMIDSKHKCEQYMNARTANNGKKGCGGWHEIVPANKGDKPWRQKSATVGGNKCDGRSGYISKNGFNPHT